MRVNLNFPNWDDKPELRNKISQYTTVYINMDGYNLASRLTQAGNLCEHYTGLRECLDTTDIKYTIKDFYNDEYNYMKNNDKSRRFASPLYLGDRPLMASYVYIHEDLTIDDDIHKRLHKSFIVIMGVKCKLGFVDDTSGIYKKFNANRTHYKFIYMVEEAFRTGNHDDILDNAVQAPAKATPSYVRTKTYDSTAAGEYDSIDSDGHPMMDYGYEEDDAIQSQEYRRQLKIDKIKEERDRPMHKQHLGTKFF